MIQTEFSKCKFLSLHQKHFGVAGGSNKAVCYKYSENWNSRNTCEWKLYFYSLFSIDITWALTGFMFRMLSGRWQMKMGYGWVNGVFKGQCNANNVFCMASLFL